MLNSALKKGDQMKRVRSITFPTKIGPGFALIPFLLFGQPLFGQAREYDSTRPFGTLREQAKVQQTWLEERLDTNLPMLMRKHGVDMWVLAMREYNEDPVFRALVSATTFAARRRTIYIFFDRGPNEGIERLALGGSSQGGAYEAVRATALAADGRSAELWGKDQWDLFARMVRERNPQRIAVNISHDINFSDGLTAGEWEQMKESFGPDLTERVVREPLLALDYLAMRVPGMTPTYRRMQAVVHQIIGTAFSEVVIEPGKTTTADVVWWMRQRVHDLGLGSWFQPSVSVQRRGVDMSNEAAPVIERGDVLHCDFGLVAMGMATDTQHMAYTHPIGDPGHGAGPLIGLWDYQSGVPGRGDPPVIPSMWFSTEMQVTTPVPEWDGQPVRMALEEEAEITEEGKMRWVLRRQTELHLIH